MTVLITGANRGIGQALLREFSKTEQVIGTTRAPQAGLKTLDVTDQASLQTLADELGPIELLICNAGVYLDKGFGPQDYTAQVWAETLAVNVTGVYMSIQSFLPNLRAGHAPRIAIISSQMASDTHAPGGSYAYRASKAAALNIGRNLATDLKPEGIAVGIYHPGWVQTDMGGASAALTLDQAAPQLCAEIQRLSLATTGCFRTYDGQDHPF